VKHLRLLRDTITWIFRGSLVRRRQQVLEQMYEVGNRSGLFIAATLAVLGMITVLQALAQIERIVPEFSMVGPAFIQGMVREFAPTITGLMIATRVGSGIAAEIGSMVVTEQVDALRMCNAEPIDYLIAPRFFACIVMSVALTILGAAVGILAGGFIGIVFWNIPAELFFRLNVVTVGDAISGLLKAISYGMAIPIVAGQAGFETYGGSEGVGEATTRAVVNASFVVIVFDLILSGLSYMVLFR